MLYFVFNLISWTLSWQKLIVIRSLSYKNYADNKTKFFPKTRQKLSLLFIAWLSTENVRTEQNLKWSRIRKNDVSR